MIIANRIIKAESDRSKLERLLRVNNSTAGIYVDEQTALRTPVVLACVRKISHTIASLPLHTYKKSKKGREKAISHPVYILLHSQANPYMSSYTWRQVMSAHVELYGDSYSEIEFSAAGYPIALWPLSPTNTYPELVDGRLSYVTIIDGKGYRLKPEQVLHFKNFSLDGYKGLSPIDCLRDTIGLSQAMQHFEAQYYAQGTHPSGIITMPDRLNKEQMEDFRKEIQNAYGGLGNAHRLMVLANGAEFKQMTISPEDSQFIESAKFQIAEIARAYDVPLALLEEHDKAATYASVEQFMLSFVIHSIRPRLVRMEQEMNNKLFLPNERKRYYVEFSLEGLLRGDTRARSDFYRTLWNIGAISSNEIRSYENMDPYDGGDVYYRPTSTSPMEGGEEPEEVLELEEK